MIDIGIDSKTGKRQQKFKGGFRTKKEAELVANEFINELNNGNLIDGTNVTFEDFAFQWLSMYESTGKIKVSTIRVRKHEISRLMDYFANYNPTNNIREYKLLTPKTKSAKRTIDVSQDVINELEEHKKTQNKFKMPHRKVYHDKDFVFAILDEKKPGYPEYLKKIANRMRRLL
ncbi:Arm DNA-binding domain-containing protein [Chengkuizengella axinellae]|uniref:Arm DNA-binding domain-containing protein n=1 Tax=Chengkuizengella axinellae TaxID=3064388 RepID=A0ABT9J4F4_9BACL|nr:Arm DNA-binding domain-containing protein [Chengkuizengella sp. 2205SS18-9]MDP5276347.1 Arm DNA-binding domain-containing protein [Chengkuizengella sp. 2205SS18-9]